MIVKGFCPMGCGETLVLHTQQLMPGEIWCDDESCPRPTAAQEILDDNRPGHLANISHTDFALVHPLRERLDGELLDCELNRYLRGLNGPPADEVIGEPILGRKYVLKGNDGWEFHPVEGR